MELDPILELKLSAQSALIGAVTANCAAVTCGLLDQTILLRGYFFDPATEEDCEKLSVAGTEIIADFPQPYTIEENCLSLTEHKLEILDFGAFMRAEVEARVATKEPAQQQC